MEVKKAFPEKGLCKVRFKLFTPFEVVFKFTKSGMISKSVNSTLISYRLAMK